jgi:heme A synthase
VNSIMSALRRLSILSLILGVGQVVFGAIVRITGSGLGCGDHWPKCLGHWFPPLDRTDLIIEVTHRYIAATLSVAILALVALAFLRRRTPGVSGRGGVLRAAALAAALVVAAALFGAVTVKLELGNKLVIVTHLAIAMTLLAVLVSAVMRTGGLGASSAAVGTASVKTWRAARAAVALTFAVLVLGAFTAHVPGANASCVGFPLCRGSLIPSGTQHIQLTHRILAFLLFFHLIGIAIGVRRRGEASLIVRAAFVALGAVVVQIFVAAALVEMQLPAMVRSLHQAVGTLVWVAVMIFALLSRRGAIGTGVPARVPSPRPSLRAAEVAT